MLLVSTGYKKAILGSPSFPSIFNGGSIRVFAGTRPLTSDAAETGQLLGVFTRYMYDTGLEYIQANEFIVKNSAHTWRLEALQAGTAAWFRVVAPGDDGQATLTQCRLDGDVGTLTSPLELNFTTTDMTAGTSLILDSFTFTIPPVSGS